MKNILITIPKGLGDSIQCLPSIDKLVHHFPNHIINLICADFLVELYRVYLPMLNVFSSEEVERCSNIEYEWFIDLASLDWSFDLKDNIQYQHIAYHRFYTCQINKEYKSKIVIDKKEFDTLFFDVSGRGGDESYDKPAWSLEAEIIAKIVGEDINKWINENIYPKFNIKENFVEIKSILFLPGGIGNKRKWPNEYFKELIKYFIDKGNNVNLILGPAEMKVIPFYKDISGLTVYDNLSLIQLSEKIMASNYIITQDCGPMHLACSLGKPVLAIFGPTNENCWFTYNGKDQEVIRKGKMIKSGFIKDITWIDWPTVAEVIKAIPAKFM